MITPRLLSSFSLQDNILFFSFYTLVVPSQSLLISLPIFITSQYHRLLRLNYQIFLILLCSLNPVVLNMTFNLDLSHEIQTHSISKLGFMTDISNSTCSNRSFVLYAAFLRVVPILSKRKFYSPSSSRPKNLESSLIPFLLLQFHLASHNFNPVL